MRAAIPLAIVLSAAGCARPAAVPPPELVAARSAVVQAQENPLSPLAIAELRQAELALAIAEREARARPRSPSARDAAYVARRRAQCSLLSSLVRANLRALTRGQRALKQLREQRGAVLDPPAAAP
ncbi:uncharacterized protein SOCE26_015320 [Sorangium cellulosum]|uniref:DUF4398 domain-containing protein n=1 Tax=Sorangium cellulosum TaxID=56 RepID=A0A2L0ELH0_SORCE|nr:DUF4398 domain-containing protein [Sorangium cellulosum]AUX40135.1 uncharacterized protein SOCE26_015320 [Sorangium cellulosum]